MLPIWGPGCALVTGVALRKGLDAGRGAGLLLPGSVRADPGWHPTFSLGAVPAPTASLGKERTLGVGWGAWPWLAALAPLEEVSGLRKFDSGPGCGRDESDCSRSLPLGCPSGE